MGRNTVESTLRFDPNLHSELSIFLVQLAKALGKKKISIQEYMMEATVEKMERDRQQYGIKKVEI